jgi:hypothetical protein
MNLPCPTSSNNTDFNFPRFYITPALRLDARLKMLFMQKASQKVVRSSEFLLFLGNFMI